MPRPRKQQISLEATPYYHCTSRCVRRAFLCGLDSLTGKDYEHRRQWVEDRILFLGEIFCINVCAYAVMSNHHHVVLHINMAEAQSLTDLEVCERWHKLYKGTLLTQKLLKGELLDEAQWLAVKEKLDQWRLKLANISRWMRALTSPLPAWQTPKINVQDASGQVFAPAKPAFPTSMLVSAGLSHKPYSMKKLWPPVWPT